jgi:hypothetical protein
MNLAELRDLIRAEAGLQGLDEYTSLIDAILNQELQATTGKAKYEELRTSVVLTATGDGQNSFDLPNDFQLLASADFHRSGDDPAHGYDLAQGKQTGYQTSIDGAPRFYSILGRSLRVYPFTGLYLGDYINFDYYKRPVLVLDADEFPIPSLEKSIQQLVMARLLRQVDTKKAQMAKMEGNQGFIESRAEHAANS